MFDLKSSLESICAKYGYKMKEFQPGRFNLDVSLKLKDGSFRYQFVYLWVADIGRDKKPCIYMNSRVGKFTPDLNLYNVLKEAGYGIYSMVTITSDKDKEGNPIESIIIQAAPNVEHTSMELLNDIIFEVAANADLLEEKFFGGDRH